MIYCKQETLVVLLSWKSKVRTSITRYVVFEKQISEFFFFFYCSLDLITTIPKGGVCHQQPPQLDYQGTSLIYGHHHRITTMVAYDIHNLIQQLMAVMLRSRQDDLLLFSSLCSLCMFNNNSKVIQMFVTETDRTIIMSKQGFIFHHCVSS